MNFLEMVTNDCIVEILKQVFDLKSFMSMILTCHRLYYLYKYRLNEMNGYLNYKLNKDQFIVLNNLLSNSNQYLYVNLPMSAGKTAIALIYCLKQLEKMKGGTALFVVPDKVLETAKIEIEKLTSGKKLFIPIFVYNAGMKSSKIPLSGLVVFGRSCSAPIKYAQNVHTIAYDEAHTGNQKPMQNKYKQAKFLLLSATTPTFDKFNNLSTLGQPIDVVGHLSTSEIILPETIIKIWCIQNHNKHFYKAHDKTYVTASLKLFNGVKPKYGARYESIPSRKYVIEGTALLIKCLAKIKDTGKTFIFMCDGGWFNETRFNRENIFKVLDIKHVKSIAEVLATDSNILLGDMCDFSEGINLNMIENVIIVSGTTSPEKIRQCLGRVVRTTNKNKIINVYYICNFLVNVMASLVPKEIENEYRDLLNQKSLSLRPSSDIDKYFVPDMSFEELIVLSCCKGSFDNSVEWIENRNGFKAFKRNEFNSLLHRKMYC